MIIATMLLLMAPQIEGEIDCSKAASNLELQQCAGKILEAADAKMTAEWNKASAYMKQQDAEFKKYDRAENDTRPGYFDALLASQRSWIAYREDACRISSYLMRGGTAEPLEYTGCMTKMAEARTQELTELLNYYQQR